MKLEQAIKTVISLSNRSFSQNVRKPFDHAWAPCWMITWMTRTQNGTSKVTCGFKCAVLSPFCESLSDVAKVAIIRTKLQ